MELNEWIRLAIAFGGGSLVGTLVKIAWDYYQERIPKLTKRVEVDRIFSSAVNDSALRANVTVFSDGLPYDFANLSLAKITILNRTRKDREEFPFGITLPEGHEAILVEPQSSDRHHCVSITSATPKPNAPCNTIDLLCKPLNREDGYTFKVYIHSVGRPVAAADIVVSTSAPMKWDLPREDKWIRRALIMQSLSQTVAIIAAIITLIIYWLSLPPKS